MININGNCVQSDIRRLQGRRDWLEVALSQEKRSEGICWTAYGLTGLRSERKSTGLREESNS